MKVLLSFQENAFAPLQTTSCRVAVRADSVVILKLLRNNSERATQMRT